MYIYSLYICYMILFYYFCLLKLMVEKMAMGCKGMHTHRNICVFLETQTHSQYYSLGAH
jgi:hypothetical protein